MARNEKIEEPIAIVGSACRFPGGATSPSKLWDLLHNPRDVLKEFDPERLNLKRFYHPDPEMHGSTNVINKSYLLEDDTRHFDASFFGITPMEAAGMDPQQRQLLETVYESFESAGLTLQELKGSLTSVHVGVMTNDWTNIQLRDPETIPQYTATGTANSIMSNRISYVFDLKGPSVTIDTACSSSLVALHHAARGLLDGDSTAAVVAGVNIILDPALYITESKLHMLSPESRSRMWDKDANGYARGEGTAALVLKTLGQALADGDHIEGIVRSTGVNSDGQSPGITMPFAPTQAALIRYTYRRAGLDPIKDRPQYFECHGTGTPAGDPVEARAVSEAFIDAHSTTSASHPLYVGSIKTVIGHLEGCAGLAGVMKVLLAIKNRTIPPNLLFNELNPAITPYYGPLRIPTTAIPWPELPSGTPARASVNSFGFGGTNAHAIIESFEGPPSILQKHTPQDSSPVNGPLLFSAESGSSLLRSVKANLEHLIMHPEIDIGDMSCFLQTRRTTHNVRAHFSGQTRDITLENMAKWIAAHEKVPSGQIGHQPHLVNPQELPGVLGVFTGQGAQWPAMGRELIEKSPLFRQTIQKCEATLQALPSDHVPTWSLVQELTADASSSRIGEAVISQPLCTAVQLGLVDLLDAAGISFDAVVGHSSGEISAVYASGIINAEAAMQIAYYRGFFANLARGAQGQKGGMLAAGLSIEKAKTFCNLPDFKNRLCVAASNAPQSVTLSGDIDAVEEAKQRLDSDGVFARILKVDTAYHSHHMEPCSQPYLQALLACNIEVRHPKPGKCVWSSSVRGDTVLLEGDLSELRGPYWVSNMLHTVLFSKAIESSIWHGGPFDVAIEVGPHPALKGPVEQRLKASFGVVPLYTGVLNRGKSDVEAFSSAIGAVWSQLGSSSINFSGYRAAFNESTDLPTSQALKDLPTYSWDHEQIYWRESALSRRYRTAPGEGNELLGRRAPDDNEQELRWRNILRLSEMPWLRGHQVLGEVLLPGAAYVSCAVEAARQLAITSRRQVQLLEVENMDILRPVIVPDNKYGVETLFTICLVDSHPSRGDSSTLRARFSYYVSVNQNADNMVHTCRGELVVHFEELSENVAVLPTRNLAHPDVVEVDCDRVYSMFEEVGLKYGGAFHTMKESSRCLDYCIAKGVWDAGSLGNNLEIHPAVLDVAFQTLLVAHAHPASRQITTALLPSHIERVRINPSIPKESHRDDMNADFESWAVKQTMTSLVGDVNIYDGNSGHTLAQVEGLHLNMVGEQDPSRDRPVFAKTVWARDIAQGLPEVTRNAEEDAQLLSLTEDLERVALHYAQCLADEVAGDDQSKFQWYHQRMLEANEEHLTLVKCGKHPILRKEWLADGPEMLQKMEQAHPDDVQLRMLNEVGRNYPSIVRGEMSQLQVMTKDDLLNRFFMYDQGCIRVNQFLADALRQITFKYPRSNILEIGAGTGGTSWSALNTINDAYTSYTFTDVGSVFLPAAAEKFADFAHKMTFKTLDIENDPATQGYVPHSYDIVIAANVLHATKNLERTMSHVRSMLRPGGYLLLFETTGVQNLSIPFIFSGLPSWWPGEEAERRLRPIVPTLSWNQILYDTGFSGLDVVLHDIADESKHTTALLVSQAVNNQILRLREPLSEITTVPPPVNGLLLIGGRKLRTSKVLAEIQKLLPHSWRGRIRIVKSVDDVEDLADLHPGTDVVCLHDQDEPLFASTMTPKRLSSLQSLLMKAHNLLWVTNASTGKTNLPRSIMFHGIGRVAAAEMAHLQLQILGLDPSTLSVASVARHCIEAYLRLMETGDVIPDDGNEGKLMWALEPETEVLASGELVIPRVVADQYLNEKYISSRRTVTRKMDATHLAVKVVPGPSRILLEAADEMETLLPNTNSIQVQYSLHIPAHTGDGVYLACGKSESTSSPLMAISRSNASVLTVGQDDVVNMGIKECSPDVLFATAKNLLERAVGILATSGKAVFLYGANEPLAARLNTKLLAQGKHAYFASSDAEAPSTWIKIHRQSSKRVLQRMVPSDVALYIDCLSSPSPASDTLTECLPKDCAAWKFDARLLEEALRVTNITTKSLIADSFAEIDDSSSFGDECEVIKVASLAGAQISTLAHKYYVVDWQERASLPVTIAPLDTKGLFRRDRTYLMVGAAGGLGLSICKWALSEGVKHMVITSRNPNVEPDMLEEVKRMGVSLLVLPMDVTDPASIDGVLQQVRKTMPPIGGVCNAAMVLQDRLFLDMSIDELNGTLAPKVDGSENLDMALADDDLEFFIVLSSSATVLGNIGQANYHIANLFMSSLVAKRRARGLAGSVVHVGHITDVGYVVKTKDRTAQLEEHFHNMRLMPLSETDVHHGFAQAIRGGRPGSDISPDIIMGVEPASEPVAADAVEATESKIPWLTNPRLGHLVPIATLRGEGPNKGGAAAMGSLRQRVEDAESEEESVEMALQAFCSKLEAILQLPEGRAAENTQRAIIDLGIDSLVAVEIRAWFLKELGVEVPVVKILGGDSVLKVCTTAARTILAKSTKEKQGDPNAKPDSSPGLAPVAPLSTINPVVTKPDPTSVSAANSSKNSVFEMEDESTTNSIQGASSTEAASLHNLEVSESSVSNEIEEDQMSEGKSQGIKEDNVSKPELIRQYRMSRAQARIWFLSKHLDDQAAYNMVFHYRVNGPLNITRLRHALQVTTQHHECLRMCFFQQLGDGHAIQGLMGSAAFKFEHIVDADDNDMQQAMARLKTHIWNIEAGETLGVTVLSRSRETHDIVFGYHHIITDVVGWFLFLQDLDRAYRMQPLNQAGSHLDYTAKELQGEGDGMYNEPLAFWRTEFSSLPELLPLLPSALVRSRPSQQQGTKKIQSEYRTLEPGLVDSVRDMCRKLRISPFHFYLAVFQVFLARQAGIEDVCVGVVDANRGGEDERATRMVGCFVNVLPVRVQIPPTESFVETARKVSGKALAAFAHAGVPFEVLLDAVDAPRMADGTTPPLFQAAVNYRAAGWGELPLGSDCRMALQLDDGKDAEPPYDISLGIMDMAEGCTIDLHCQGSLYSSEATREMVDMYVRLVGAFAADPYTCIDQCSLQDNAKITQALELGNGDRIDFQWPATLSQRVREMFRLYASAPAIVSGEKTLTYAQLAIRVGSVSRVLRSAGCIPSSCVGVLCDPSLDSIVAMLAILQTGCVYVPLDTSLPTTRHAAMVQNCEPRMILHHAATEEYILELSKETSIMFQDLRIDDVPDAEVDSHEPCSSDRDAPAILLYTSGSTGTPKGVRLTQGNFANHLALKTQILDLGQETVLQQSSLGFDMSIVQTFCALANGGCLVVAPQDVRRDPVALATLIHDQRVSLTIATPSEYLAWMRYGFSSLQGHPFWRHACMGGEPVPTLLKREFLRLDIKGLRLTNCYGPTETTAAVTFQSIDMGTYTDGDDEDKDDETHRRAKYAVGKALPNYSLRILDNAAWPLPIGYSGEIFVGGAGVALDYLGMANETRKRFIVDRNTGDRLYRTGDKGQLLPDGTLLCFGRIDGDTQVKLRGLRIELEEVETALIRAANGLLSTAVVSVRQDVLIAHAVPSQEFKGAVGDINPTTILGRLQLPQYCKPAALIILPALPINPNGKLDRKAISVLPLPTSDERTSQQSPQEPMNISEGELRLLWERVLPESASTTMGRIVPSSDFFLYGGNSLLLMRLQAAIRESMGVEISTRTLYSASTLRNMAKAVLERRHSASDAADEPEDINWSAETAVPTWLKEQVLDDVQHSSNYSKPHNETEGLEVVLTGASGFLGGRLLHTLLQSPLIQKVHCVAIAADDAHTVPQYTDKRVRIYTGSLADKRLGLTIDEFALLGETANVIVHAGANGHCLNNYATLQVPNLNSTHWLASMALSRTIPLLFVSSNRVALLGGRTEQPAASLADCVPPVDGSEGYTASKWAAEVFLEKLTNYYTQQQHKGSPAKERKRWAAAVHRPCVLVGEQAPNSDSMNAILRFSLSMRCVPLMRRGKGYIDFAPIDGVAEGIVEDALRMAQGMDENNEGVLQFKHHSSGVKVPVDEFGVHLGRLYGDHFEAVDMRDWIVLATKAGIDPLITAYLDGVLDTDEEMVFPYLGAIDV